MLDHPLKRAQAGPPAHERIAPACVALPPYHQRNPDALQTRSYRLLSSGLILDAAPTHLQDSPENSSKNRIAQDLREIAWQVDP